MSSDCTVPGGACTGGAGDPCAGCGSAGACTKHSVPLDPRQMTSDERRAWLENYRRHLEERLAEVDEQLAALR
jgi:hypothetical protein